MEKLTTLLILIVFFASCVQEIPEDELIQEAFTDREVAGTPVTPPPVTPPKPEAKAALVTAASLSGNNYIISFALPSGGIGAPQGGYDTFINGVDQNDRDAHNGFSRIISGLDTSKKQCFKLEARYLQEDPAVFLQSNELCIEPIAGDKTAPVIQNIMPGGSLPAGTTSTLITFTTTENATCRYSKTSGTNFAMMSPVDTTGDASHSHASDTLKDGENYSYYFRCQDGAMNISEVGISSFAVIEVSLDGQQLYAENCMSCHSPLSTSTKKNRTAAQIQNAIINNGRMKTEAYLQNLTAAQVAAISEALSLTAPPPPPPSTSGNSDNSSLNQKYIIGTRRYLTSKFMQIFYEQDKDNAVKNTIEDSIFEDREGIFGGNCTIADTDCNGTDQIMSAGLMLPNSHPIRSAKVHNVCQQVLNRSKAINSALIRAGLNSQSSGNSNANILSLFDVFYPGVAMSQEALSDLKLVYNQAIANGLNNTNAWKMVMDPMCKSSLFEAN